MKQAFTLYQEALARGPFMLLYNTSYPLSVKNRTKVGLLRKGVELLEPYSFTYYDVYQTVLRPKRRKGRKKTVPNVNIYKSKNLLTIYLTNSTSTNSVLFFFGSALRISNKS